MVQTMQMCSADIIIAGGANVDIKWRAMHKILLGTTTKSQKTEHSGGVARNIAECLARLHMPCRFFSYVGNDENGRNMIEELAQRGVDVSLVKVSNKYPTATYCAVLHPSGDLYASFIDLSIYDACDSDVLKTILAAVNKNSLLVLDTDLSVNHLKSLAQSGAQATWVSVTCVPAVEKIKHILGFIDVLFLNQQEFSALCPSGYSFSQQCSWLHTQGLKSVVVTLGAEGVMLSQERQITTLPAHPVAEVVDVTGAGDALVAGTLYHYARGKSLHESLLFGIKAASLTIASSESVSPHVHTLLE